MTAPLSIAAHDRVLIFAPHPDDESLAAAGLLQATLAAGGAVRVVLLTDGDNNPWPQRWIEKRWFIGRAGRTRWGARRRAEAQRALLSLGVEASDVRFLGLPDSGLTELLMSADAALMQALQTTLSEFRPTRMVIPGLQDRHPDHSAAQVLARLAIDRVGGAAIEELSYLVHTDLAELPGTRVLYLTPDQVARKRAAIAAHDTQVRLSGRRFLGFARSEEYFLATRPGDISSAPRSGDRAAWHGDALHLQLAMPLRFGEELLLVLEYPDGSSRRARLARLGSAEVVRDALDGTLIGNCAVRRDAAGVEVIVEFARDALPRLSFAKRQKRRRGLMVFDRAGWFEAVRGGG